MITLGVETSCDETSVALVKDGKKILSNIVYSSLKEHQPYGGVIPEIASRSHLEEMMPCLRAAFKKAHLRPEEVDCVAVTQGPGLMGSLLVGLSAAKAFAYAMKKPLVGVDHVVAHLYSAFLEHPALRLPLLGLVVSGGHTMLIRLDGPGKHQVLGKTLDDAAGEAFDKVAKLLGLGYPGGPEVDKLARQADPNEIRFNRPYATPDSLDFSFSGIKTAVLYRVQDLQKKGPLSFAVKRKLCAGFQEAVCEVLVEKSIQAARKEKIRTIVVGGGVSANSRLRKMMKSRGAKEHIKIIFPSMGLCQDNAAMIASYGTALYRKGKRDSMDMTAYPNFI